MTAATPTTPAAPLSNPVAEAAIIAGLVNCGDPAAIGRYLLDSRLDSECFTMPAFRTAHAAIVDLAAAGQPVDLPILAQRLDEEDLAAVDSACREHVSAANFTHYARILTGCKQRRAEAAARDRLAQAAAAGAPEHELAAIVESIRIAGQDPNADREPRFQWADEFCRNRPDTCWLIDDYMPASSIGVLFGDSESWKTFLAIDMAGCIATGRQWRGKDVRQGNVLFIAGEGGYGLRARIQAWFDYHGEPMRNFAVSTVPLELCDPKNADDLIADIRRFAGNEQFVFIVLDTLSTHFGSGDENVSADMNKFRRAVLKLSKATDAAVAIIHHPGHNNKDREKGAITLRQGIDWGYRVERVGDVTTITPTKTKDAPKPPPLSWTLQTVPLPWVDAKQKPINGAVLVPATLASTSASTNQMLTRQQRIALTALDTAIDRHGEDGAALVGDWKRVAIDAGITQSESRQGKYAAFQRAVDALVDGGHVIQEGNAFRPSTRQHASTNRQHVDNVDRATEVSMRQHLSTHPFRGVDNVYVDAEPKHSENPKPKGNGGGPIGEEPPPAEPPRVWDSDSGRWIPEGMRP